MKVSTGLRNTMLAISNLKAALAGGEMRLYAGPIPASADDAIGAATLLLTITGINFDAAADGGILSKAPSEVWEGTNSANGVASFYRHVLPADTGASSSTALRLQGTVAVAGADLNLTSVGLASGAPQAIDFYSVAMPAG